MWAHFLSLRAAQRKETGLSAPIPHKKGGALFAAVFPLQSLARPLRRPLFTAAAALDGCVE
jgi:hypothetical protein